MIANFLDLMGNTFLLLGTGFYLEKIGKIDEHGKSILINMLIYAIIPCNIVKSFSLGWNENVSSTLIVILTLAIVVELFSLIVMLFAYKKLGDKEIIYQYSTICPNAFMGNPFVEGLFGEIGMSYASVYLIPQRIVTWTIGISLFQNKAKENIWKKVGLHPCMCATYVGLTIMIFHLSLPKVLSGYIGSASACCTPITLIYVGTVLADIHIKELIQPRILLFAAVRLLFIPGLAFFSCKYMDADPVIAGVAVIYAAMPAGSLGSVFAAKYHKDYMEAAKVIICTTSLSLVTIPFWSYVLMACMK